MCVVACLFPPNVQQKSWVFLTAQLSICFIGAFGEGRVFFYACLVEDPTPNFPLPPFWGGSALHFPFSLTTVSREGKKTRQWRKKKVFFPFSHRVSVACLSAILSSPCLNLPIGARREENFFCLSKGGWGVCEKVIFTFIFFPLSRDEGTCLSFLDNNW